MGQSTLYSVLLTTHLSNNSTTQITPYIFAERNFCYVISQATLFTYPFHYYPSTRVRRDEVSVLPGQDPQNHVSEFNPQSPISTRGERRALSAVEGRPPRSGSSRRRSRGYRPDTTANRPQHAF